MKKYIATISHKYKREMEHRVNIFFANFQSIFTLFVLFFFWKSVFGGREMIKGYTFAELITYYFLIRVTYNRVSTFGAARLAKDIKKGSLTKDILKPINYINYVIFNDYVGAAIWTVGNLIAILCFSYFLHKTLLLPNNLTYTLMFLLAFLLNGVLTVLINIIIGSIGFWSTEVTHLKLITTQIISALSGGLIPLVFFPEYLQKLLNLLPFKYLVQFPSDLYLGKISYQGAINNFVVLGVWILVLYIVAQKLFYRGLKTYESYN